MGIRTLNVTKNAENTIIIPLHDSMGEPILSDINGKQAKIEVYGRDSKAFKKAWGDFQRAVKPINDGKEIDTIYKQETRSINLTKGVVIGWENVSDFDDFGNAIELEFTSENLESVLRSEPNIVEQIDKEMTNRANFVKKTEAVQSATPKK